MPQEEEPLDSDVHEKLAAEAKKAEAAMKRAQMEAERKAEEARLKREIEIKKG